MGTCMMYVSFVVLYNLSIYQSYCLSFHKYVKWIALCQQCKPIRLQCARSL